MKMLKCGYCMFKYWTHSQRDKHTSIMIYYSNCCHCSAETYTLIHSQSYIGINRVRHRFYNIYYTYVICNLIASNLSSKYQRLCFINSRPLAQYCVSCNLCDVEIFSTSTLNFVRNTAKKKRKENRRKGNVRSKRKCWKNKEEKNVLI